MSEVHIKIQRKGTGTPSVRNTISPVDLRPHIPRQEACERIYESSSF